MSRWLSALARRPFVYGPLYGILVYGVMNLVVVPLSAAAGGPKTWPVVVNGLLIHIFGVRLPERAGSKGGGSFEHGARPRLSRT